MGCTQEKPIILINSLLRVLSSEDFLGVEQFAVDRFPVVQDCVVDVIDLVGFLCFNMTSKNRPSVGISWRQDEFCQVPSDASEKSQSRVNNKRRECSQSSQSDLSSPRLAFQRGLHAVRPLLHRSAELSTRQSGQVPDIEM